MVGKSSPLLELATALRQDDSLGHHIHLVGIGGWGMSAIARILIARGFRISGSDVKESANTVELRAIGAEIFSRHRPNNVDTAMAVVVSSAIGDHNPEVVEARKRGIAILQRASVLNLLMKEKIGIAVAGTAGKSSTSAMLVRLMNYCGKDASYAIGARLHDSGVNAALGNGPVFIAEADESDSSFLLLAPDVAIITNIESDHLAFHGTMQNYWKAFECFTDRIARQGMLITSADDIGATTVARHARKRVRVRTFGEATVSDLRMTDIKVDHEGTSYRATLDGNLQFDVRIRQPGRHMAKNAAGALLAAYELGIPMASAIEALSGYEGVARRFDHIGLERGVHVFDDFAHSPTKVREQLCAAKTFAGEGKLRVVFEAPRVKGEQKLAEDFASALAQADMVLLVDEAAARKNTPMGAGADGGFWLIDFIARELDSLDLYVQVHELAEILVVMREAVLPGDVVVTMGERDMSEFAAAIVNELR